MAREREDVLAQLRSRVLEGHGEPALHVRLHLAAEAEREAPIARTSELPGVLGGDHRAARERDRDRGAELDGRRDRARHRAREERRPLRFGEPQPGEAELFDPPRHRRGVLQSQARGVRVELHVSTTRGRARGRSRCAGSGWFLPRWWRRSTPDSGGSSRSRSRSRARRGSAFPNGPPGRRSRIP